MDNKDKLSEMKIKATTQKTTLLLLITFLMLGVQAQNKAKIKLKNNLDTVSYAIGLDLGSSYFKAQGVDINLDALMIGIEDGMSENDAALFNDAIKQKILVEFSQAMKKKQQQEMAGKAMAAKAESQKFLEDNKKKEGIQVTESGLQYIVLKEGSGERPVETSTVKVHYHGTLIDGTVFDSSIDKGAPIEFKANRVIRGWTEGLQLMTVGSKYKFFIPQELAYGASPRQGGKIKPFDALIFEVELLEIVK